MRKCSLFLIMLFYLYSCSDTPSEPHQNNQYETEFCRVNINPFLMIDSDRNAMIFYGQDTVDCTGYIPPFHNDGEWDLLMLQKYNQSGELILAETNIITTRALLDYAVYRKDENIYVIWFDPCNYPDFRANYLHTYYIDIYYKNINKNGNIVSGENKLSNEILYIRDAQNEYHLGGIYSGTIKDLQSDDIILKRYDYDNPSRSWIIVDSRNDEHHLKIYGSHMGDSCRITYTRYNTDSLVVIEEQTIASFYKMEGEQWGPGIQNFYAKYDGIDRIHLVWQLNDGRNDFIYYYENIDVDNMEITLNTIGKKYP